MKQIDIMWKKQANNPVHRCFINGVQCNTYHPRVIKIEYVYYMYYSAVYPEGITRIHLATSTDLRNWKEHPENPVLDVGGEAWESNRVTYPLVIREGSLYYMCYTGYSGSAPYRMGMATSDDLVHWKKYKGNPIIDAEGLDAQEAHTPCIVKKDNQFYMLYSGADSKGIHRILLATSPDMFTWTKYPENPVIDVGPEGSWDHEYLSCPSVVKIEDTFIVFYTGQPLLDKDTQIGMAYSKDFIHWVKSPANPILKSGAPGEWDSQFVGQGGVIFDSVTKKLYMLYIGRVERPFAIGLTVGNISMK